MKSSIIISRFFKYFIEGFIISTSSDINNYEYRLSLQEQELYNWLIESGLPHTADIYKDSLTIWNTNMYKHLSGSRHFIAHALREVMDGVLRKIINNNDRHNLSKDDSEDFKLTWPEAKEILQDSPKTNVTKFVMTMDKLFQQETSVLTQSEKVRAVMQEMHGVNCFHEGGASAENVVNKFKYLIHQNLHKIAHIRDGNHESCIHTDQDIESIHNKFLDAFHSMISYKNKPTDEFIEEIDKVLDNLNYNIDNLEGKLNGKLTSLAKREYFFSNLKNPNLLSPLNELGYFSCPPESIKDGDRVLFPHWPELMYLKNIYIDNGTKVVEVLKGSNLSNCKNPRIHGNVINLLSSNHNIQSWPALDKELDWVKNNTDPNNNFYLSTSVLTACLYLLSMEQSKWKIAINDILKNILLLTDKKESSYNSELKLCFMDGYELEDALKKISKVVLERGPNANIAYIKVLSEKLLESIKVSLAEGSDITKGDASTWWRPAIEEHKQNYYNSNCLRNLLVNAIHNHMISAYQKDLGLIVQLMNILDHYEAPIFKRIQMSIATQLCFNDNIVEEIFVNLSIYKVLDMYHEAYLFFKKHFANQKDENQHKVLEHIIELEDDDSLLRWLIAVESDLNEKYLDRLQELRSKLDIHHIENPDFLHYITDGWEDDTQALTKEDFDEMSFQDISIYLSDKDNFSNRGRDNKPSKHRTLAALKSSLKERKNLLLENLDYFKLSTPAFVSNVIDALIPEKETERYNWEIFFDYVEWVTTNKDDNNEINIFEHGRWIECFKSIINIINCGVNSSYKCKFNGVHLKRSLKISLDLYEKGFPYTQKTELDQQGKGLDSLNLAINSLTGKVIEFHCLAAIYIKNEMISDGKEEIESFLTQYVSDSENYLLSNHALLGKFYPWLYESLHEWAKDNTDKIFPLMENIELFNSSWKSYIIYTKPFDNIRDVLYRYYESSVNDSDSSDSNHSYIERLIDHIVVLSIRRNVGNENNYKPLGKKIRSKHPKYFFSQISRMISSKPRKEIINELLNYWNNYISEIKKESSWDINQEGLSSFSYFINVDGINNDWVLDNLILLAKNKIKFDTFRLFYLSDDLLNSNHHKYIELLFLLIEGDLITDFHTLSTDLFVGKMIEVKNNYPDLAFKIVRISGALFEKGFLNHRRVIKQ